jgi:hypothetical protein
MNEIFVIIKETDNGDRSPVIAVSSEEKAIEKVKELFEENELLELILAEVQKEEADWIKKNPVPVLSSYLLRSFDFNKTLKHSSKKNKASTTRLKEKLSAENEEPCKKYIQDSKDWTEKYKSIRATILKKYDIVEDKDPVDAGNYYFYQKINLV